MLILFMAPTSRIFQGISVKVMAKMLVTAQKNVMLTIQSTFGVMLIKTSRIR